MWKLIMLYHVILALFWSMSCLGTQYDAGNLCIGIEGGTREARAFRKGIGWADLKTGETICSGCVIQTGITNSSADITISDHNEAPCCHAILSTNSIIEIIELRNKKKEQLGTAVMRFRLLLGKVTVEIPPQAAINFEIMVDGAPVVISNVEQAPYKRKSIFTFDVSGRLNLLKGEVNIRKPDQTHALQEGQELRLRTDKVIKMESAPRERQDPN